MVSFVATIAGITGLLLPGAGPLALAGDPGVRGALPGQQQTPAGAAAFVSIVTSPGTLAADGFPVNALYVQLLDARGQPATSPGDTIVHLQSSDTHLATVPPTTTVPANTSAAVVEVTPGHSEGEVTFTADAPGLTGAQAKLKLTTSPDSGFASALFKVALGPGLSIAGSSGPALVTVSVLNAESNSPLAVREDLEVTLVSSDATVLAVPANVTIPAGSYTATAPVTVGKLGGATITALHSGFASGSTPGSVRKHGTGAPAKLTVVALPAVLSPAGDVTGKLVIQALDIDGAPVDFPCGQLQLSSSNPAVLDVPAQVQADCQPGRQAILIDTIPGGSTGSTGITVAASGMLPGEVTIAASGIAATKLTATIAPAKIMYGQPSAGWLVLQVTNDKGLSASVARDTVVTLAAEGMTLPATVTMPRGSRLLIVPLGPLSPGATPPVITATATSLASAQVTVTSNEPSSAFASAGRVGLPSITVAGRSVPLLLLIGLAALAVVAVVVVMLIQREEDRAEDEV